MPKIIVPNVRHSSSPPSNASSMSFWCGSSTAGGRSLVDLMTTLHELTALGVGFVSLTEALDLTTPAGRAFAGFLAVFAEFERDLMRERIKAGITDARRRGKPHGRPRAQANDANQIRVLAQQGFSQAAIARHLGIWRTSVRRALAK